MPPRDIINCESLMDMEYRPDLFGPPSWAEEADLISLEGTARFQWHVHSPLVTVRFLNSNGDCEKTLNVPMDHARRLWSKMIDSGWRRKV